jgi:hypothetical protein
MKRISLIAMLVLLVAGAMAFGDQRVSTERQWYTIYRNVVVDTVVADSGGLTWFTDAGMTQATRYWVGATMTVIDATSDLTDSTRVITAFFGTADSSTFSAFATDSVEKGDSLELVIPTFYSIDPAVTPPVGTIMDSVMICTTETYRITPGASLTSAHVIEHSRDKDSAGTNIVLQVAVSPVLPHGQSGWMRMDSISYATQDTIHYKAWGALQAHYVRFILDPVNAEVDSCTITHYGQLMVDK